MRVSLFEVPNPQRWAIAWGIQGLIDLGLAWWLGGFPALALALIGVGCLGVAAAHVREYRRRCTCGHQLRAHPDPKSCLLCNCDDYDGRFPPAGTSYHPVEEGE